MELLNYNIHSFSIAGLLFCIMQIGSFRSHSQTPPLVGKWTNSYGSGLTITRQNPDGSLVGTYVSSTGSTGIYQVDGHCFANPENGNTALILLISWNSLDGSTRDPSRFWTSSMSGVFYPQTNSMELLNCISAATPFGAVQMDDPGVYPETLFFRKEEEGNAPSLQKTANEWYDRRTSDPLPEGEWKIDSGNSSPYTTLNISNVKQGQYFDMFSGLVTVKGLAQPIGIKGLVAHESPNGKKSLSFSLTAPISVGGDPMSFITGFSGLLNIGEQTLKLVITPSSPVDYKNKYAAIRVDGSSYSKVK